MREEDGFTLIELMVVLLIIAILLAIAIPTFLGARKTANARSTQEDLRNALTAEQTYWTANQTFATNLASTEVSLIWETAAPVRGASDVYATTWNFSATPTQVTTAGASSDSVMLEGYAKDNNCYAIFQSDNATTDFTAYYEEASSSWRLPTPSRPPGAAPTRRYHRRHQHRGRRQRRWLVRHLLTRKSPSDQERGPLGGPVPLIRVLAGNSRKASQARIPDADDLVASSARDKGKAVERR